MSEEVEETIPDEPLDVLVEADDSDLRAETRDTSRANLAVYLGEIARIGPLAIARRLKA